MAPPVNELVGSTAITPTVLPVAPARDEPIDERALAGARCASHTDEKRAARSREQIADKRRTLIGVVLDERDAASDGAEVAINDEF